MLQQARTATHDPQLRALYGRLLPVLQQHRDLAQTLEGEIEREPGK